MKITNRNDLPQPIVDAVAAMLDRPQRAENPGPELHIGVTRLIDSPLIRKLYAEHRNEIEVDASDSLWALFGTTMGAILEKANDPGIAAVEREIWRDFVMDDGRTVRVIGHFDRHCLVRRELQDYKVTSAWSVIFGKDEWEEQLNVYRYLLDPDRALIDSLAIYALLRDWQRSRAAREPDYPQEQVARISIPMWSNDYCREFIGKRLEAHFAADAGCSDKERWAKPGVFAVMKPGRKTAVRLLDSKPLAEAWIANNGGGDLEIIERPTVFTRCESYCAVSKFCPIWTAEMSKQP